MDYTHRYLVYFVYKLRKAHVFKPPRLHLSRHHIHTKSTARHNCRRSPTELQSSLPWHVERFYFSSVPPFKKKMWMLQVSYCVWSSPAFQRCFKDGLNLVPTSHYGPEPSNKCLALSAQPRHRACHTFGNPKSSKRLTGNLRIWRLRLPQHHHKHITTSYRPLANKCHVSFASCPLHDLTEENH